MKRIRTSFLSSLAFIAILAAVQACSDSKGNTRSIPSRSEAVPVKVMALEKSSSAAAVIASGQLSTEDESTLGFKIGGVVSRVLVKEGDAVKKGQLLATLDQTEIDATVAQARHGFEKAQRDYERTSHLYHDSVATLEQWQNSQTALDVAREQLAAARFNKSHAEIRAAGNGYVLSKFINPGQVVGAGERALQCNVTSNGNWILKVSVSDKQWALLKVGEKAVISIDAFPDQSFPAVISRKSETVDRQTGTFTVELRLDATKARLATGMFGSAKIQSAQTNTFWSVPYESVLDASGDEGFVFVTRDDKTAHKQRVTVASFDGQHINIRGGLDDAGKLIISGSAYLSDNSPITIIP